MLVYYKFVSLFTSSKQGCIMMVMFGEIQFLYAFEYKAATALCYFVNVGFPW